MVPSPADTEDGDGRRPMQSFPIRQLRSTRAIELVSYCSPGPPCAFVQGFYYFSVSFVPIYLAPDSVSLRLSDPEGLAGLYTTKGYINDSRQFFVKVSYMLRF